MGRFTPKFAWRNLVPDVSSPLLGVSVPRRTEKRGNEIFVTMGVNGEFLHFGGFWAISQQRLHGSPPNFICVWTMSADVPPLPVGSIGPWGRGQGELKTQKNGGLIRAADSYHFYFSQRCHMWFMCRAQTCAHSGVGRPKRFYRVGQIVRKKFRIFHHFETLRPYISETIKIRGI